MPDQLTEPLSPLTSAVFSSDTPSRLVLITAARNESEHIEKTLRSVIAQTLRPLYWIIVDDASDDQTPQIVTEFIKLNPWIELISLPDRGSHDFARKARGFNAALLSIHKRAFDFVANIDADVSFGSDYLELVISKFNVFDNLGVAGTWFIDDKSTLPTGCGFKRMEDSLNVVGGCQVFRRECIEAIGGYSPVPGGGIDTIASVKARMCGWKTITFKDTFFIHHRNKWSTGRRFSIMKSRFRGGLKSYCVGGHPLWEFAHAVSIMSLRPVFLGGACFGMGFFFAALRNKGRPVSDEFVAFYRAEQLSRARRHLRELTNIVIRRNATIASDAKSL